MEAKPITEQALHVVELQAENIMRLKAVRITPDGNVVILGGENEQGKSSVLRCIEMAIAGAKAIPDVPIRRGEKRARIVLDLGDLVIERTFEGDKTKLIVRNADGVQQASPQAILDRLYSKVAFSPLEFASQKPAEQLATLKRIVGLDFTAEDAKRAKLYEERTIAGRRLKDAEAAYLQYPISSETAPDEEVSISALLASKDAAEKKNAKRAEIRRQAADARKDADTKRAALEAAEKAASDARDALARAEEDADFAQVVADDLPPDEDTAPILQAIAGAEETNRAVRAKQARRAANAKCKQAEEEKQRLSDEIQAIDDAKTKAMELAKWPILGLGFSESGVTLNGLPFEQSSKAQRMKASLAIGMEQNPQLRVLLLQDASLLDRASMDVVRQFAEDNNMQVWIERVSDGDPGAIIIEDGEIKGTK